MGNIKATLAISLQISCGKRENPGAAQLGRTKWRAARE
jgi:hypothetical protein